MEGADAVLHAATLHKPHVGSHPRQAFVETNVTGTLTLLEEAVAAGVGGSSSRARRAPSGGPWCPLPASPRRGSPRTSSRCRATSTASTKTAAEDLCELVHRDHGLPCLILRTSRFFPEADDRDEVRSEYEDANLKVNELLYRRVDLEDVVERPPAGAGARPRARLRPLHHQRDDALRALRPRAPARRRPRPCCAAASRPTRRSTRSAAGGCSLASTACTSTPRPAMSSGGRRVTTSPTRSNASAPERTRAASSPAPSAPRATTRTPPASTRRR